VRPSADDGRTLAGSVSSTSSGTFPAKVEQASISRPRDAGKIQICSSDDPPRTCADRADGDIYRYTECHKKHSCNCAISILIYICRLMYALAAAKEVTCETKSASAGAPRA
jgi:hypothetical protein